MDFSAFVEDIRKHQWNVFGAEVYVDGKLTCQYGDTEQRYPIYSATKTITALAAGMAAEEGKMDIHASVLEYLPANIVEKMKREQREIYRHITVQRLMTMSVGGYPFRPEGESWLKMALEYPIPDAQRREFHYSNMSAYLVGVAATHAVGEDLYGYLDRKLFAPLGIEHPPFGRCPDGYFYGASMMELSVHELSKIGMLLYCGGEYEGKRIVSEAFVKKATSVQQMNREGGYAYFIWKYGSGFSINGKWKQKCYVLPKEKIIVTFLSHIEDPECRLIQSMEQHILGRDTNNTI